MNSKHVYNLIAGFALIAFTATGFAAELLSADLKLSTELTDYALATESTKTGSESAEVTVIVRYKTVPDQQEVNRLTTLDASTKRAYSRIPMRAIRVPVDKLDSLADDADVEYISLDTPVEAFTQAARLTANEPVMNNGSGQFTGNGIGVAVIDSG